MKLNNKIAYTTQQQISNKHTLVREKRKNSAQMYSEAPIHNNNIIQRPAKALSFSGSAVSMSQKFVKSKWINAFTKFVNDNEAAYNAVFALVIAGILKPLVVVNMPGSEEKDKQLIATKNFLQAFIGAFMGYTIGGGFVKKSFDIIKTNLKLIDVNKDGSITNVAKNSEEALEVATKKIIAENTGLRAKFAQAKQFANNSDGLSKAKEYAKGLFKKVEYEPSEELVSKRAGEIVDNFVKNHLDIFKRNPEFVVKIKGNTDTEKAFTAFWKNSTGAITSIAKAKVSSMLLPAVVGLLFGKKAYDKHKKNKAQKESSTLLNSSSFQKEKAQFDNVLNKQSNVSFKGNWLNKCIDNAAIGFETLAMKKGGVECVDKLQKWADVMGKTEPSARMADLESILLTGYWVQNTARSKKIAPDQKFGLNLHTVLVTLVSSTCAFLIDRFTKGPVDAVKNQYKNEVENIVSGLKNNLAKNASKEEILQFAKKEAEGLLSSEKIAKQLSKVDLANDKAVAKVVEDLADSYGSKITKLKSLTIFTFVVRFFVPVLLVPLSGYIKKKANQMRAEQKAHAEKTEIKK